MTSRKTTTDDAGYRIKDISLHGFLVAFAIPAHSIRVKKPSRELRAYKDGNDYNF